MTDQQRFKAKIRDFCASILSLSGLTQFSRFPVASLTIVTFHRVLPAKLRAQYPLPGLAVTPQELHWVLTQLKPHFDIRTLSDAFACFQSEQNQQPLLAVTFDDGQWDNLEYGLPVLSELDIPATFYVPTAFIDTDQLLWHDQAGFAWQQLSANRADLASVISSDFLLTPDHTAHDFLQYLKALAVDKRQQILDRVLDQAGNMPAWARMMSWDELKTLQHAGHEIGSHGRSHQLLSQQSFSEQEQELLGSYQDIKEHLGVAPQSICYPNGNYNDETLALLKNAAYQTAVTTTWGINRADSHCFELKRCDVNAQLLCNASGELSLPRFQFRLSGYQVGL